MEHGQTPGPSGLDLKIARVSAGVRQYEVAAVVGVPAPIISLIESGRREATPQQRQAIQQAIGQLAVEATPGDSRRA